MPCRYPRLSRPSARGMRCARSDLKGGRRVARLTTLPARQRDSAHWRKPRKKKKKSKRRVKSVGLNDGDKNGKRANGGKERKRDKGRMRERKREKKVDKR